MMSEEAKKIWYWYKVWSVDIAFYKENVHVKHMQNGHQELVPDYFIILKNNHKI